MSVCLGHDSDVAAEAALRLMPKDETLPFLDFNDPQVFGAYYDLWFQPLVRFVRALTPLDEATAEDMVQNAFVRVLQLDLPPLTWRQFRRWIRRGVFFTIQTYWTSQGRLQRQVSVEALRMREQDDQPHPELVDMGALSVEDQVVMRERLHDVVATARQDRLSHQWLLKVLLEWGYDARQVVRYMERHGVFHVQLAIVGDQLVRVRRRSRGVRCAVCGGTERPRFCQGMCHPCYTRHLRQQQEQQGDTAISFQCAGCGLTQRPHHAKGYCRPCYKRVSRAKPHDGFRCQGCGTTERPHEAWGLCLRCYRKESCRLGHVVESTNDQLAQAS